MELHMLTTVDNPYNPFDDFDGWHRWDTDHGYHTASFLARITRSSNDLSEAEQDDAMETAIDEIVRENVLGIYVKIKQDERPRAAA